MQKYALTPDGHSIFVFFASKKGSYFCPSCHALMKVREGPFRSRHFYHLNQTCPTSAATSLEHLQIQKKIVRLLASKGASIEVPFPAIGRIADISLPLDKLIFEVQCSPISKKEVKQRICAYGSLGFKVVWILHDQTFNRTHLSPSEAYLLSQPHYYTNIDQEGKGIIYDRLSLHLGRRWLFKGRPRAINLAQFTTTLFKKRAKGELGYQLNLRRKKWGISFSGDLFSDAERADLQRENRQRVSLIKKFLYTKNISIKLATQLFSSFSKNELCSKRVLKERRRKGSKSRSHFL